MPVKPLQAPEIFQKPIASVDTAGLPPRGSPEFDQALIARIAMDYAGRGWNAVVTVDDAFVRVVAVPAHGMDPKTYVLGLLRERYLEDALPLLEALHGMLDDADIAYNYGICLSELGRVEDALAPLERCIAIDAAYTNAHVGLGVACARLGRNDDAERALRRALQQEPANLHAARNLAGVLARSGKPAQALPYFRQAAARTPDDADLQLGLAQCLEQLGGEHAREADALYAEIMKRFPAHPAADAATRARNRIANAQLHAPVDGAARMDAVFYMQGAMDTFAQKSQQELGRIVMEIAQRGQSGLQINKPEVRYTLESLPGEFSGLHLLCLMHVGIRLFDATADTGTGLDREYELALAMRGDAAKAGGTPGHGSR